jgi:hypothetical protein
MCPFRNWEISGRSIDEATHFFVLLLLFYVLFFLFSHIFLAHNLFQYNQNAVCDVVFILFSTQQGKAHDCIG